MGLLLPLSELLENDAIGEALSADTDPLQHTVTPQLVQNQVWVQFASLGKGQHLLMSFMLHRGLE